MYYVNLSFERAGCSILSRTAPQDKNRGQAVRGSRLSAMQPYFSLTCGEVRDLANCIRSPAKAGSRTVAGQPIGLRDTI